MHLPEKQKHMYLVEIMGKWKQQFELSSRDPGFNKEREKPLAWAPNFCRLVFINAV
jgi:hypothetical protein